MPTDPMLPEQLQGTLLIGLRQQKLHLVTGINQLHRPPIRGQPQDHHIVFIRRRKDPSILALPSQDEAIEGLIGTGRGRQADSRD